MSVELEPPHIVRNSFYNIDRIVETRLIQDTACVCQHKPDVDCEVQTDVIKLLQAR